MVELPVLGAFVGVPVAGLIDGEHMKLLRQHRDVAREVRPARRAGTAAVQQHHRLLVADTRLVIVQLQRSVNVDVRITRGGLERQLFASCIDSSASADHTIVSPGGNPNSLFPKIW